MEVTVKRSSAPIRKLCAGAVALAVSVLCLAPPCRAGDPAPAGAVGHSIAALSPATLARLAQQPPPEATGTSDNASFFKSKRGVAVLVLIGAGFGYTLYSKSHDRVLSAVR
jgi:hypothetical protein